MRREERFAEFSRAVAHDIEQRVCETSWEVLLVGVRPPFDAQADLQLSQPGWQDGIFGCGYMFGQGMVEVLCPLVICI
jgi:hypothetical protein